MSGTITNNANGKPQTTLLLNEADKKFKEWWSEARKSEEPPTPFEFLTNFGIIGDSVSEAMMKMFWTMLFNSPGVPGRLDYFVHYLKDALAKEPSGYMSVESLGPNGGFDGSCPESVLEALDEAGNGDVTEQELKSMIEIVEPSDKDLILSMERHYSLDLVNSFFEKQHEVWELNLPLYDWWPRSGRVLDDSLLVLIKKHIGKFRSVRLGSGNQRNDLRWTHDGFAQCLRMMIHGEGPSTFELCIPEEFQTDVEHNLDLHPAEPNQTISGGIKDLTLYFSSQNQAANQAAMELIPRMAGLQVLTVYPGVHLNRVTPYLAQCLQSAPALKDLIIEVRGPPTKHDKVLSVVLKALQTNSSLEKFHYEGRCSSCSRAARALYDRTVLKILQDHNVSLRQVRLGCELHEYSMSQRKRSKMEAVQKQVDYYLMLNWHGRGRARDSELQLKDFVTMLGEVNKKLAVPLGHRHYPGAPTWKYRLSNIEALNAMFGILQERPGLWACSDTTSLVDGNNKSRKRKLSNEQDG